MDNNTHIDLIDDNEPAIMILDEHGHIKMCNSGNGKTKGYKIGEIIGQHFRVFYTKEDQDNNLPEKLLQEALIKGRVTTEGWRVQKDDSLIWSNTAISVLYNEQEKVTGFTKITKKIHEFNEPVNSIKQEQTITTDPEFEHNSLCALINNTHDHMWSVDRDFKLITANDSFNELVMHMTGKTIQRGDSVFIAGFTKEQLERYRKWYERAFSGESFKAIEYTDVPVVLWAELSFYPIRSGDGIIGAACYSHNITDRKIAEEKIKLVGANLNAIFENSFESLVLTDTQGIILAFNNNARKTALLTSTPELQIGHNFFDYIEPSRKDVFGNMISEVSAGKSIQYDQSFYDFGGNFHCYDFSIYPVRESGVIIGICFNGRDVTESKLSKEKIEKNEKRLEAEQKKYAELFTQAPSCICILTGLDFVYEMANPLYLQLTGKKDIIGKTAAEVFPELVTQGFLQLLESVYRSGVPFAANEQFIQIDLEGNGQLTDHYMNFVYQPYKNAEGETEGIFFFANLVSEQVQARKKIEQKEKYFRALVENANDIISLADKDCNLTYVSPAFEKITGYTADEILGKSYFSIVHPDHANESRAFYAMIMNTPGLLFPRTNCFTHKNGDSIWLEGSVINLLGDDNVNGVVGNLRDVTANKIAEEKLINANRLFAFISGINQTIVHAENEQTVFKEACRIAVEVGKFNMAWVGQFDDAFTTINLIDSFGMPEEDLYLFRNVVFENGGPVDSVLQNKTNFVCNDLDNDLKLIKWKPYVAKRGLRSYMVLPIKKDGEIIGTLNLFSSELNLFDDQEVRLLNEIAGDISFAVDVFEKERNRKKAEAQLIHNKLRMKQAQAIAHVGSFELDFSTGDSIWSEESCRIYGFDQENKNHTHEQWLSYIHPDDVDYVIEISAEMNRTFCSKSFHHRIIRTDGTIRNILSEAHFEFDSTGRPIGLYGVAHDITDIKQAEAALEQSEANLRLIMDLIPQSIFAKNNAGNFLFANKSFADLYGISTKELMNRSMAETIPVKSEYEYFIKQDREVISSGKTMILPEETFTDSLGNKRLFHTVKVPFTIAGTNEKAVLGITMDITEQKRGEIERTKMITDIVQRNKDLEQFSYIVSHNLRAPVANIMGLTEV